MVPLLSLILASPQTCLSILMKAQPVFSRMKRQDREEEEGGREHQCLSRLNMGDTILSFDAELIHQNLLGAGPDITSRPIISGTLDDGRGGPQVQGLLMFHTDSKSSRAS